MLAISHFARRDNLRAIYPDTPGASDDIPPSVAEARILDSVRAVLGRIPPVWTPAGIDDCAADTLAVVGAIRWGALHGIETGWDGEAMRCADLPALLDRLRTARPDATGDKGAAWPGGPRQLALRYLSRATVAGYWAGQQTLARIWTLNAEQIRPVDGMEQVTPISPTGYDQASVGRPIDDGFSVARHSAISRAGRPVVELLAVVGADTLIRHRGWRRPTAWVAGKLRRRSSVMLPQLMDIPLRGIGDIRRLAQHGEDWVRYPIRWSAQRRYIGYRHGGYRSRAMDGPDPWTS